MNRLMPTFWLLLFTILIGCNSQTNDDSFFWGVKVVNNSHYDFSNCYILINDYKFDYGRLSKGQTASFFNTIKTANKFILHLKTADSSYCKTIFLDGTMIHKNQYVSIKITGDIILDVVDGGEVRIVDGDNCTNQ